jgi:hypothetical protein
MFLLGESTTESEVSGQMSQKEGSIRVEGRGCEVHGSMSGTTGIIVRMCSRS